MNLTLFLLLALTSSWTRLVQCEDKEETETASGDSLVVSTKAAPEDDPENHGDVTGSGDDSSQTSLDLGATPNNNESVSVEGAEPSEEPHSKADTEEEDLNTLIMIIIPLVLSLVIIAVIVCVVFIYRRVTVKADDSKEDPYLDDDEHEKVPMPMFEDDIPSVMELEMEDLENWMAKDGGKKVDTGQI